MEAEGGPVREGLGGAGGVVDSVEEAEGVCSVWVWLGLGAAAEEEERRECEEA